MRGTFESIFRKGKTEVELLKKNGTNLRPLTVRDIWSGYSRKRFGIFNPFLKKVMNFFSRLVGRFSFEDQINIACMCEPPMFFLNMGIMIAHAYGITLSADHIGCDVYVGQNVTIGTNGKNLELSGNTAGHKPRIGNLVRIYSHAIVSGEISLGDCVLVAAGSIVTKDVPSKSIVYGKDQVKKLGVHHYQYLRSVLFHCDRQYVKIPGLTYRDQKLFIDEAYLRKRAILLENLEKDQFFQTVEDLF